MTGLYYLVVFGALVGIVLLLRRRTGSAPVPQDVLQGLEALQAVSDRCLRHGTEPSDAQLEAADESFMRYFDVLTRYHRTEDNRRFSLEDQAGFYGHAVRLTALAHPSHNAWPMMSEVRDTVHRHYRTLELSSLDPWTQLALIMPALLAGDVARATLAFEALGPRPDLQDLAVQWAREGWLGYRDFNDPQVVSGFLARVGQTPSPLVVEPSQDSLTPAQRWVLSVAIFPSYAQDPRVELADPLPPAVCRISEAEWWDVTSEASLQRVLQWLLEDGHRAQLAADAARLDDAGPVDAQTRFVLGHPEARVPHAILAWDLCRLMQVARSGVTAGFVTEDAAWTVMFVAARRLRTAYGSWSEMGEDYLLGAEYFDPEADPEPYHVQSVRWLQGAPESPWQRIPWDIDPDELIWPR